MFIDWARRCKTLGREDHLQEVSSETPQGALLPKVYSLVYINFFGVYN
jgi:hypothetical protein